jgi:U4/U6.U5 tri-snRNP-associated protein 1
MGSTKKHKIRESKKRKHRSRSKSRSPDRSKHRHHKKHHKDRKKEKIIKDKNGEFISKFDTYDSEGKLRVFWVSFFYRYL